MRVSFDIEMPKSANAALVGAETVARAVFESARVSTSRGGGCTVPQTS